MDDYIFLGYESVKPKYNFGESTSNFANNLKKVALFLWTFNRTPENVERMQFKIYENLSLFVQELQDDLGIPKKLFHH